jgi:hypothetical protein
VVAESVLSLLDLIALAVLQIKERTNYEVPPNIIVSILLLLLHLIQIFSSALCSQILAIFMLPFEWMTKFHTHIKQVKLYFCAD